QGLLALGRNVSIVTREGSRSPLGYLHSLLAPDGSVRYSRTGAQTPVWVTAQALTALAQKAFPIAPPGHAAARAGSIAAGAPSRLSPAGAHATRPARASGARAQARAQGPQSQRL